MIVIKKSLQALSPLFLQKYDLLLALDNPTESSLALSPTVSYKFSPVVTYLMSQSSSGHITVQLAHDSFTQSLLRPSSHQKVFQSAITALRNA